MPASKNTHHVVIMGGGFAGTLSAIVWSRFANSVTVVDPRPLEGTNQPSYVAQASHVHIFLQKGQEILEELVPGILAELQQEGAFAVDWSQDTEWQTPYGILPKIASGVRSLLFSRKLLDRTLKKRLTAFPNVRFLRASIKGLEFVDNRVVAAKLSGQRPSLAGDFFVDAMGRNSNLPSFLPTTWGQLRTSTISNRVRYVSTEVKLPTEQQLKPHQYYRRADGHHFGLGYYGVPMENGRGIFTAVDYFGTSKQPLEALREQPLLTGQKKHALKVFNKLHSHYRHYTSLGKQPANLMVLGDALCTLNPVYGQGLTIVTQQVKTMQTQLERLRGPLASMHWFRSMDKILKAPWFLVNMEKAATAGKQTPWRQRLLEWYMAKAWHAAMIRPAIQKQLLRQLHGLEAPTKLFQPKILGEILLTNWQQTAASALPSTARHINAPDCISQPCSWS